MAQAYFHATQPPNWRQLRTVNSRFRREMLQEVFMARRKSKSKSSPGTAQEQAPTQITSSTPLPGTRPAPQAAPTAHAQQEQQQAAPTGMVRKGTFIMGVGLALVLGLYVGSLIPSMLHGSAQQPIPPQQAARTVRAHWRTGKSPAGQSPRRLALDKPGQSLF